MSQCPKYPDILTNKYTLKRHLKNVHSIDQDEIEQFITIKKMLSAI